MRIIKSLIQKLTNNQDRNQDGSEKEPDNDIGELTRKDLFRGNFHIEGDKIHVNENELHLIFMEPTFINVAQYGSEKMIYEHEVGTYMGHRVICAPPCENCPYGEIWSNKKCSICEEKTKVLAKL